MDSYGVELIVDLKDCDVTTFNRKSLRKFFKELCIIAKMQRSDLHFWESTKEERETDPPHLVGTSAIQFITTSNITIHTLDILGEAYINFFTCKDFDPEVVIPYIQNYFKAKRVQTTFIPRGKW